MPYGTVMYSYYGNYFKITLLIIVIKNNTRNCFKQYIYAYTYISIQIKIYMFMIL